VRPKASAVGRTFSFSPARRLTPTQRTNSKARRRLCAGDS
jgi:hypothetical protein